MTPQYDFRESTPTAEFIKLSKGDKDEGIGTTKAGYAPPSEGPFECANCRHYSAINGTHGGCDQSDVIRDAKAGEIKESDGRAIVARGGCCNYFRKGEN